MADNDLAWLDEIIDEILSEKCEPLPPSNAVCHICGEYFPLPPVLRPNGAPYWLEQNLCIWCEYNQHVKELAHALGKSESWVRNYCEKERTTLSQNQWDSVLAYWGHKCAVCGKSADMWTVLAQDHWIPFSKGGETSVLNIVPLCHSKQGSNGLCGCNNSKKDTMPTVWLLNKFGKRKAHVIASRIDAYFEWVLQQDL